MPIVAIVSAVHSAGEEIARQVAKRLHYTYLGEELIEEAAKSFAVSADQLRRAMGKRGLRDSVTHEQEKSIVYIKATLAQHLLQNDLVYHGPAAHLIPASISHTLKVGIVGDAAFRAKRAAEKSDLGPEQALQEHERADVDDAHWTEMLFSRSPWDARLFDMKIPVPATGPADAVDLICENATKEALRPTPRSEQAARDFLLAARVNLKLLENGHYYCDVSATGNKLIVVINKNVKTAGAFVRALKMLRYEHVEDDVRKICRSFEEIHEVETKPGQGFKKPSRALLVDDEVEYVLTLSDRLETRDISADVLHDGEQALAAMGDESPDVMVLDLRMPGIDGLEVLRRVKKEKPRVEVIILTGHGGEEDERVARELGAFAFLTKPVDIDVLAKTMKEASEKARQAD